MTPLLIVLTGPSGVGKDAVFSRMRQEGRPYHFTVTVTTRPRREGERDGVDYVFASEAEMRRLIDAGELIEWAEVYGNLYGVPKAPLAAALSQGKDVIVKTDVQGVANIRSLARDAVFIFIAPPSLEELARRLGLRKTESPEALERRLHAAEQEMEEARLYEHVVINRRDLLYDTVREIESIVERERHRDPPRRVEL